MRHRMLVALVAASLPFSSGSAGTEDRDHPDNSVETMASDPGTRDLGGAADPEDLLGVEGGAKSSHRVEKGDTLWDLSGRFMGSPWNWPKVWSFNPEIENPHWIFPGDRVRLAPEGRAQEAEEIFEFDEPAEEADVAVVGTIGYQGEARRVRSTGIITPRALQESGTIAKSWEEKSLLAAGDKIYLDWPEKRKVQVGHSYVVFRTEEKIYHPTSRAFMGHFTKILGSVRVVDASPWREYVTAVIEQSFEEIERGDRIGPDFQDFTRRLADKPNAKSLVGRIAATLERGIGELGQDHLVFIDRGKSHGVEPGNSLLVLRAGDGLDEANPVYEADVSNLPAERLGELLVVEVQDQTAAAVVVRAVRELRVGDRVVMQAASR